MEKLSSQLDLYLTEISIELLGNKIYDINGMRQDKIINLFKALPEVKDSQENENSNDFLCSLSYVSNFTENEETAKAFLSDQFDFILQDANTTPKVNEEIIKFLREYKKNQAQLLVDVSGLKIQKLVERSQLVTQLNKSRINILNQKKFPSQKVEASKHYYECEKNDLLKMSMDTLRLMKYIINDTRNEEIKGELIGFVHAMRSVKDAKNGNTIRQKPYRLPKDRQTL